MSQSKKNSSSKPYVCTFDDPRDFLKHETEAATNTK